MITITNALLDGLRGHIVSMVSYGMYRTGGAWYRAEINSAEVRENGAVHVTFYIERKSSQASTATEFQLRNAAGAVLAERAETITFIDGMDRVLVRFKFGISVGSAE